MYEYFFVEKKDLNYPPEIFLRPSGDNHWGAPRIPACATRNFLAHKKRSPKTPFPLK